MFRAKTVFVIGAGASFDFDFPLGDKLLEQIAESALFKFDYHSQRPSAGNQIVYDALRRIYWPKPQEQTPDKLNEVLQAGTRLNAAASQYMSIDGLIENLQDEKVTRMAKMAIASAILDAEARSRPFQTAGGNRAGRPLPHLPDLLGFQPTWYRAFARCLFDGVKVDQVETVFANVSFVIFNYDRCLEQYLYQALMVAYPGMTEETAQRIVAGINIVRPYGSVGILPWQRGNSLKIGFGHGTAEALIGAHESIITFSEQIADKAVLKQAKAIVGKAARIVFLGFGFHMQNIRFLATTARRNCEIYGTVFRLPPTERLIIERELRSALGGGESVPTPGGQRTNTFSVELIDCDCRTFCTDYWRTLTGGDPPDLGLVTQSAAGD